MQSDELDVDSYSEGEAGYIEEIWRSSRFKLKKESSKIRMLFKEVEIEALVNAIQDLDREIMDAHSSDSEQKNHRLNVVWSNTGSCVDEAIKLSRKKCL